MRKVSIFLLLVLLISASCQRGRSNTEVVLEGLVLSEYCICLYPGMENVIKASALPSTAKFELNWSSENSAVCEVSKNGTVTALQPGKTVVSVSCGAVIKQCDVYVLGIHSRAGLVGVYPCNNLGLSVNWAMANVKAINSWNMGIIANNEYTPGYDDAYTGYYWRTATKKGWEELFDSTHCDWVETHMSGHEGIAVISKVSGFENCGIFLPVHKDIPYMCQTPDMHLDFDYEKHTVNILSTKTNEWLIRNVTDYENVPMD